MIFKPLRVGLIILLLQNGLFLLGTAGCGSTGDGSNQSEDVSAGTGSGNAVQDTFTTLNSLLMVASTSLSVSSAVSSLNNASKAATNQRYETPGQAAGNQNHQHQRCVEGAQAGKLLPEGRRQTAREYSRWNFGLLRLSRLEGATQAPMIDQHVHCDSGEQASVSGNNTTDGDFELNISMNDCEGVAGGASYSGTSTSNADSLTFSGEFTGGESTDSVGGNGCTLSLTNLGYTFSVPLDTIVAPISEMVFGSLSSTCTENASETLVACDFGTGVNAQSPAELAAACD